MSASEEFREHLKAGNLGEAMNLALSRAIELQITTWVARDRNAPAETPEPGHAMKTRLNIVDGEVENAVGTQFIGNGPYRELREFHSAQVQNGQQMIQQNLESLQQVFTMLTIAQAQPPQSFASSTALPPAPSSQQTREDPEKTY